MHRARPFNDSDTAQRGSAIQQNRTNPQVGREAQDNFRKDDDVRWQWRRSVVKDSHGPSTSQENALEPDAQNYGAIN